MSDIDKVKVMRGYLYYTRARDGVKKYKSEDLEWKTTIVVDEETADAFDDATIRLQGPKKIKAADFESTFKVEPPYPAKVYYAITLKQPCISSKGKPMRQPAVLIKDPVLKKLKNVVGTTLVGNGSKGQVECYFIGDEEDGYAARLQNILIEELVPYEERSGSAFGDYEEDDAPVKSESAFGGYEEDDGDEGEEEAPAPKPAPAKRSKTKKAAPPTDDDDEDDSSLPF